MVSILTTGMDWPNLQSTGNVRSVEDQLRRSIHARKVRLTEYFKDFDRLRTGFITKDQFDRCLDQLFDIVLNAEDDGLLMEKYGSDPKQKGMVNYRRFCEVINAVFDPNHLKDDPSTQSIGVDASANIDRRPLSPASLSKCDELLMRMAVHYQYHGINIKTCYADFDKHHIGVVTQPQFYRSFPGPPDITEAEVRLLGKKYRDEDRPGLCNYYRFHFDIEDKQTNLEDAADFTKYTPYQDEQKLVPRGPGTPTLDDIFEKIRVSVFKNGIRTPEFFRDHDKLRSGIITENQFICGLSLCCGTQANLSRSEIQKIVDTFKTDDGRVVYKDFCDMMENAFTLRDLEKMPTADPYRPPMGALAKAPNVLSDQEEARVQEILKGLIDKVRKRRLMVYPYFKDFDRSKGYTRGVTKTQFARLLHFLSLDLQPRELELICKKYECPYGGDINYPAFSQAIDSEYIGTSTTLSDKSQNNRDKNPTPKQPDVNLTTVNPAELIGRIRHHVLVNRIRVEEFFQDFDPLRHGSISKSQFRQCLNSLGQKDLTDAQFEVLSVQYADSKRPGNIKWTQFLTDVEIVFTKRGLEKEPTHEVPPVEAFQMPRPGACCNLATNQQEEFLQQIMLRMRKKIEQRRILCKPIFQDFDRHNNGHVTKSQARQCLLNLGLTNDEHEMKVIEAKYSDDTGFHYTDFLEQLQPTEKPELMYIKRLELLKTVNSKHIPDWGEDNLGFVMHKLKSKVMKERIRVIEFMKDYDKLRTGRMTKVNFARAMDLSSLGLTKFEMEKIMDIYAAPGYPGYINYLQFSDDVEEIFTIKNLEKNPLAVPEQFNTHVESENTKLLPEAEILLEQVMHRLADRVRIRRIQIFPLFEDYDRVHNGTVSRGQFHRVLSELDIGTLVSAREFAVLYQKFDVIIGLKHDFNYISFCDMINDYALFEFGMP